MTLTEELGVKPGDVYVSTWGYDQTNVDFYEVVRVTASKAELRPIGSCADVDSVGNYAVVPNRTYEREYDVILNIDRGDAKRTKLCTVKRGWRGEASIVLESGRHWAHRWDGRSMYETGPYNGH
jgi:hypothetical protein